MFSADLPCSNEVTSFKTSLTVFVVKPFVVFLASTSNFAKTRDELNLFADSQTS